MDGDALYALGSDGDLACLETASGKVRWQKNLRTDFGGKPGEWAYAESPLVDGDVLVCTPGGAEATLVALNKKTGEVDLEVAGARGGDEAGYASVIVVEAGGVKQYVQFLGKGVVGVDAEDRQVPVALRQARPRAARPTSRRRWPHDGYVYSGHRPRRRRAGQAEGRRRATFDGRGGLLRRRSSQRASAASVLVGDTSTARTAQALMCVEFATGEVKWEDRGIGAGVAVLSPTAGCTCTARTATWPWSKPRPRRTARRAASRRPDQPDRGSSKAWAYPVVANGRLYIRDMGVLWCYDIKS